jgi:adenine-specific DNA-methyltransferase
MLPAWWPSDKPWIIADCLEVMKEMPDKSVNLLLADLPYNEGKDTWDNIKDYLNWWESKVIEFKRVLKENGVLYFFHMNMETSIELHNICKKHGFVFRQMITLNKGLQSVAGRTSENLRSFPKATEYLFYYTFCDLTGAEQLSDEYQRINPMSKYLKDEFQRAEVSQSELRALFPSKNGKETGCVTNWVKGYNFPLKEQYETMRQYINKKYGNEYLRTEYEYLRTEYEDLRTEYEDLRYTFNLPYGVTDVWDFNTYNTREVEHSTPKPVETMERIILASSKPGDIVFDPFLGSGTTLLACRKTGRIGLGCEINPDYEEIIRKRSMQDIAKLDYFAEQPLPEAPE